MKFSPATQSAIEEARARVRVGYPWWLRPFLFRDVAAITLSRRIFVSADLEECAEEEIDRLMRHELAHVRQVVRIGFVTFVMRYGLEFVMHFWRERSVFRAYRLISFEIEARAAEEADPQSGL